MTAHNVTRSTRAWTYGSNATERAALREHPGTLFETRPIRADGGQPADDLDELEGYSPSVRDRDVAVPLTGAERLALDPSLTTGEADPRIVAEVAAVASHVTYLARGETWYTLAPVAVENSVYYGVTSFPPEVEGPAREQRGVVAHDREADTWTVAVFTGERNESLARSGSFEAEDLNYVERWDTAANAINNLQITLGGEDRYTDGDGQ